MAKKGENIFKRKDGRWEARYIHHYENGKAVYRYLYGKTYTEAKAKKRTALSFAETTAVPHSNGDISFEELANLWLENIKISVKESTYTRYDRIVHHYLVPMIKNQSLANMDTAYLSCLTAKLLKEGGRRKRPLSAKTVSDILCVLKTIFRFGRQHNYPCPDTGGMKYPSNSFKNVKIMTEENRIQLEKLLMISDDPTSLGIFFTLFTGVRIGELCGIRWEDIDFTHSTVNICRTVERIADLNPETPNKTKVIISTPKTGNSVRIIPLPDFLMDYLKERKQPKECYLITGTPKNTEPHQYYIRYKKILKQNHIDSYTFHALRHTFATRCVELDFDIKSLSEILGHSDIATTLSFYVHPTMNRKKMQMNRLSPANIHLTQS